LLLLQGCVFHFHDGGPSSARRDVTDLRFATLEVGDATRVRVRARAGSLRIEGHPGLGELRASGTAYAGSVADLEHVALTVRRVGTDLVVETDTGGWSDGWRRFDLVVEVPDSLPLEVDDESGGIEIYDVAAVELRDGSGSIDIERVAGDVRVVDGSGGIDIRAVRGTVVIEADGSGSIDITDVGRDVIVEEDGSGGINVSDVGGDFVVDRDGSGGVRHQGVRGRVDVPSD
jgi:hypothetical protein